VRFREPRYVGDPINAVRIFNEKEVDELVFLDIAATASGKGPNFDLLHHIASEAFMPFGYGGGITDAGQIRKLFAMGVEKIVLNTAAEAHPELVSEAAALAGSSSVVVSIDVKKSWLGRYGVYTRAGQHDTRRDPVELAREMQARGAGEILLNSIDRDGTFSGYDLPLIAAVAQAVDIPVVACGGAGELRHFREAVDHGASAVSAGSLFVFHGRHKAVLITYPDYTDLEKLFAS
jgi:cyclase